MTYAYDRSRVKAPGSEWRQ